MEVQPRLDGAHRSTVAEAQELARSYRKIAGDGGEPIRVKRKVRAVIVPGRRRTGACLTAAVIWSVTAKRLTTDIVQKQYRIG